MKSFKKVIGVILTMCLILSCFSTVALAADPTTASLGVLIDENYDLGQTGDWTVLNSTKGSISNPGTAVSFKTVDGSSNNTIVNVARRPINNGDGYAFEEGKTFVIETRIKQGDPTSNMHFKINSDKSGATFIYDAGFTLFAINNGKIQVGESEGGNWGSLNAYNYSTALNTSDWINVKIELKGDPTGQTQAYGVAHFEDEHNNTATLPFKHAYLGSTSALKSIDLHSTAANQEMFVDSLRVSLVEDAKYFSEDYSDGKLGAWYLFNSASGTLANVDGAISFTSVGDGSYKGTNVAVATRAFNGGAGIPFEDGKKIVIQTKVKETVPGSGFHVKLNVARTDKPYPGYNGFSIFMLKDGDVSPATRSEGNWGYLGSAVDANLNTTDWVDIKIELEGDPTGATPATGTAYFTDVDGKTATASFTHAYPGIDALKTFGIYSNANGNNILVDEFKVSVIDNPDITIGTIPETVKTSGEFEIPVTFASGNTDTSVIKDFFSITKGGAAANATITPAAGKLSVAITGAAEGDVYTLTVNKAGLTTAGYRLLNSVTEYTIKISNYIVNEDYNDDALGDWQLFNAGKGTLAAADGSISFTSASGNTTNYTAANVETAIRPINSGNGIAFEEGKTIVIETKMKQSDVSKGFHIKLNMAGGTTPYPGYDGYSIIEVGDSKLSSMNGVAANAPAWGAGAKQTVNLDTSDWLTFKIELKGDGATPATGTAYVTDKTGKTESVAFIHTAQTTPGLKSFGTDSENGGQTILVDYLKVYVGTDVAVSVPNKVKTDGQFNIPVTFGDESTDTTGIKDFFTIKKNGNAADATITPAAGKLSVAITGAAEGDVYTLSVNKDGLAAAGYNLIGLTTEYTISISDYIINEDYNNNALGEWKLFNAGKGTLTAADGSISFTSVGSGYKATDVEVATRPVNGADGVVFEEGKIIVIETKMKQSDVSKGFHIKLNTAGGTTPYPGFDGYSIIEVGNSSLSSMDGVSPSSPAWGAGPKETVSLKTDDWLTFRIELKGDPTGTTAATGKAYITDTTGKTEKVAFIHTAQTAPTLKSVDVASENAGQTILVDYLKVSVENAPIGVTVGTIPSSIKVNGLFEIPVTFANSSTDTTAIKDFFSITKDGSPASATITPAAGKLSVEILNVVEEDEYKLTVNRLGLAEAGYELTNAETEYTIKASDVLFNEDYNDGSTGAWAILNAGKGTIANSDGALSFTTTDNWSSQGGVNAATRPLNGDTGYAFETGKTLVIETRIKQSDVSKGLVFKVNSSKAGELAVYDGGYALFKILGDTIKPADSVDSEKVANLYWGLFTNKFNITTLDTADWLDVKIELRGDSTGATQAYGIATFTDADGETAKMPFKHAYLPGIDALKSVEVHSTGAENTILVDYLKISLKDNETFPTIADIDLESAEVKQEEAVYLKGTNEILTSIMDYVKVYDENDSLVTITKELEDGKIKITSSDLVAGSYTVKIDKSTGAFDNYLFSAESFAFAVVEEADPIVISLIAADESEADELVVNIEYSLKLAINEELENVSNTIKYYAVVYDGNQVKAVIDGDATNAVGTYTATGTITPAQAGYTVKVFAWDTANNNIKPLCKATSYAVVAAE